jgi:hypothetical protein
VEPRHRFRRRRLGRQGGCRGIPRRPASRRGRSASSRRVRARRATSSRAPRASTARRRRVFIAEVHRRRISPAQNGLSNTHVRNRRRRRAGPVNQEIYDSLLLLQHRGQDSTGIATAETSGVFHLFKAKGRCARRSAPATCAPSWATSASATCATPRRAPRRARKRRSPSTSTRPTASSSYTTATSPTRAS